MQKLNNKHFLSLAGNGFVAFFGLLYWSILYKSLPTIAETGKFIFFFTVLTLFEALRGGFLQTATIKFYAGTEEERGRSVLGSIWFLGIALTASVLLLNALAYCFLPFIHNEEIIIVIKWVGVTYLSTLIFNVVYWKLQADEQYGRLMQLKLVNSGSTFLAFLLLAITKKMTLESALLYNLLTNCLTSVVALLFGRSGMRTIVHRSRESIMEVVHYGKFSLATTLSSNLLGGLNSMVINFMLGPAAVAIFSIPVKLLQIIEIPLQSFVGTGMSGMAVAVNQNKMSKVADILRKYAGMLTLAFVPMTILALLFADLATYAIVLGSHKYSGTAGVEAANIFRLFMLICLLYPIDRFNGATLDIIHKPKINFYKVLVMLTVNAIADFVGIAIFKGLYGIVFASALTTFSGIIYGYYHLNKYLPVTIKSIYVTGYDEMRGFIKKQLKTP